MMITMDKKLIEKRREIKAKKPNFVRSYYNKKVGLKKCWRKAEGLQNKVRLCHRGMSSRVEVGFGSPREVRGLSREGLEFFTVNNVSDLKNIKVSEHIIIISSCVGNRKRAEILNEAKKIGVAVYNFKNIDDKITKINQRLKESKKKSEDAKKRVLERLKKTPKKDDKDKADTKKEEVKEETKEDVKEDNKESQEKETTTKKVKKVVKKEE